MEVGQSRVFLVGLMGAGKSTVGHLLAARLGCAYVDNDTAVAAIAGRSTVALAGQGGTVLHDWESRYVRSLPARTPPVVAGVPASTADLPHDLALLADSGLLVYLRADVATLVARVSQDPPRPWLHGDPRALITGQYARRDPVLTAAARLVLDATLPASALAAQLVKALDQAATAGAPPGQGVAEADGSENVGSVDS